MMTLMMDSELMVGLTVLASVVLTAGVVVVRTILERKAVRVPVRVESDPR